jgi:5-methyltetrahydropteroyltriglutamate--homocysteine methyltransferase
MSAASPGVIAIFQQNQYYGSDEEYIAALADAMKTEYDAIHAAGLVLQLDCPDLAMGWNVAQLGGTQDNFLAEVGLRVAAINHATRDIPPEMMRLHLCWGNYEGPHTSDIPLRAIIGEVLRARPAAISFEGANPRHEHEWAVFEDIRLPDGKAIIPGVIDSTTNYVEHPELVAQRITRYAHLVGRENVLAGSDCGFATFATSSTVDSQVTWAKLAAMAEGAALASAALWA